MLKSFQKRKTNATYQYHKSHPKGDKIMNRTLNPSTINRTAIGTQNTENFAERDYLFIALLAVIRFFALPRVRAIITALTAMTAVIFTLGMVGGVETGGLPFVCLIPLTLLWGVGALYIHCSRK